MRAHSSVRMEWYTAVPPFCWEEPGTNHLRCTEGSSEQRSAEPDGWRWRGVSVGFTVTHTAEIFVLEPKLSSWVEVGKSKLSRCCPFYVRDTQHIFMTLTTLTRWFSWYFSLFYPLFSGSNLTTKLRNLMTWIKMWGTNQLDKELQLLQY